MSNMKVSIVIPNWNGRDKLLRNLPQVLKVKGVHEIIVSDDASSDDSIKVLKKHFPQIKLVKRKVNGGFSTNVNTGVKEAKGDLIFLLNTDAVPAQDCLKYILPHFQNEKVFSVGLNSAGNWTWVKFENGFFWHFKAPLNGVKPQTHQTLWSSGGSGVFRRDIWDSLGGLDELFSPFYEEDVDIGYRATKRGFINIWEAKAIVEHYKQRGVIQENFSSKRISEVAQRNQLFFIWKNMTDINLILQHIFYLVKMLLLHPKYWPIFISAFKHFSEVMKKRSLEKQQATLTDKEILSMYPNNFV